MLKNDVKKVIQKVAEEHDFDLTLADVDELLKIMEESFVEIGEQIEVGERVNVGVVVVEKKATKERKGVSELSGEKVEWTKPATTYIKLSTKESFKKAHTEEV